MIKLSDFIDVNKPVIEISSKKLVFIHDNISIADAAEKIISSGHRRLPVLNKKKELMGIVTTTDMLHAFLEGIDVNAEISNIMVRDVVFCESSDKISYVVEKFKISKRGGFPVLEKGKVVAMVTEHDIIKLLTNREILIPVSELMTRKPLFIRSYLSILDALKSLVAVKMRRLPVLNGKLQGLITTFDVLKYLVENDFNPEALDEPVELITVRNLITVKPSDSVSHAIDLMINNSIGGLLVVDNENLEGIITERDVLKVTS